MQAGGTAHLLGHQLCDITMAVCDGQHLVAALSGEGAGCVGLLLGPVLMGSEPSHMDALHHLLIPQRTFGRAGFCMGQPNL